MNRILKKHLGKKLIPSDRGFTLLEMIISLVVGGIVIATIAPIFRGNARSFYTVTAGNESIQAARIGFNRMMADLRDIALSTAITNGTANSITFSSVENTPNPVITYAFTNNTVTRTKTNVPTAVLIPGVTNFTIAYFDTVNGSTPIIPPVANQINVWSIRVTLDVTVVGQNMTFQSTVHPRNIF